MGTRLIPERSARQSNTVPHRSDGERGGVCSGAPVDLSGKERLRCTGVHVLEPTARIDGGSCLRAVRDTGEVFFSGLFEGMNNNKSRGHHGTRGPAEQDPHEQPHGAGEGGIWPHAWVVGNLPDGNVALALVTEWR